MAKRPVRSTDRGKMIRKASTKEAVAAPPVPTTVSGLIAQIVAASRTPTAVAVPPKPLPAGTVGQQVPIAAASLQQLITAAAAEGSTAGQQVWTNGPSELAVITGKIAVALDDGLVVVTIPVSCDQLSSASIQVPFAMGGKDTPAGIVVATEERPRGPALIVDLWGEALTAYAWRLLITLMHRVSLQSGVDQDGAGLVPIAFTAAKDGITVLPMARHTFDRVRL
jgi:hypothetical protein